LAATTAAEHDDVEFVSHVNSHIAAEKVPGHPGAASAILSPSLSRRDARYASL